MIKKPVTKARLIKQLFTTSEGPRIHRSAHNPDVKTVTCSECSTPTAQIERGTLVVKVRHHGEVHTTAFSLAWIKKAIEAEENCGSVPSGQDNSLAL